MGASSWGRLTDEGFLDGGVGLLLDHGLEFWGQGLGHLLRGEDAV